MASISIRNIGPLKHVDIKLNRFNVFIGPQSVGKSTVAKLISFCNWLEKDCVLRQDTEHVNQEFIEKNLLVYHNLEGYLTSLSEFVYNGDVINLVIRDGLTTVERTEGFNKAGVTKNAYIPSERNMLSLPGIFAIKLPDNYLLEFIDDWQEVRSKFKEADKVEILNLRSSYFYNAAEGLDMIKIDGDRNIRFNQASSGLQSVVPLCVCIEYLTKWIYEHEENRSAEKRKLYREMLYKKSVVDLVRQIGLERVTDTIQKLTAVNVEDINNLFREVLDNLEKEGMDGIRNISDEKKDILLTLAQVRQLNYSLTHPVSTNLVIEEPEQNLFPETQVSLVYFMLSKLNSKDRDDSLVVTTHSPYVLYALNNCMLASLAAKDNEGLVDEITAIPKEAWVNPAHVSVWEIRDGSVVDGKTIQDERGLVRGNYFERVMHNVMADFSNLLTIV